jgi:hypothetical protein
VVGQRRPRQEFLIILSRRPRDINAPVWIWHLVDELACAAPHRDLLRRAAPL